MQVSRGTWKVATALVATLVAPGAVRAEEAAPDGWAAYQKFAEARSGECVGPEGTLETPLDIEVAGHRYQLLGDRLKQVDTDKDKALRIGVISATKDDREETLAAIASLIAQLKAKKMDLLLVNGDIASHEINVDEKLFPALADSGVLTLVFVGNTESCGYFNQAATKVFETHRNLINGNWVRQLELEDGVVYTLPGYHDRRFVHTGGAGHYNEDDVYAMRHRVKAGPGPKIVVSHGPPMMKGPAAIDIATGAGHVGDPQITDILKVGKVPFGIFGHILEAGGRASDLTGAKGRKPKKWAKSLYVNAGSANPDPWTMLNKRLSYGMALFVEVQGDKARYEVLRLPEP